MQDTWRVSSRLTLNYGLRYNLQTPWVEVHDRQVNFAPFTGAVQVAGQSTYYNNNRALYNQYNGPENFQPRIGLAYQYAPSGVLRASYTMSSYMEGSGTNLRLPLNPPYNVERGVQFSQPNSAATLQSRTSGTSPFSSSLATPPQRRSVTLVRRIVI